MIYYMVYISTALGCLLGLSTKGDRSFVHIWEYYDQLPLKQNWIHYRRVRDAFFGHYMCLFDKELPNKRVSNEVWNKVNEYSWLHVPVAS